MHGTFSAFLSFHQMYCSGALVDRQKGGFAPACCVGTMMVGIVQPSIKLGVAVIVVCVAAGLDPYPSPFGFVQFTHRFSRDQGPRTESLRFVHNRQDRAAHFVVVIGEPTPSFVSSFALPELQAGVREYGTDNAVELLDMKVEGQRLRVIADLPLDLAF